MELKKKAAPQKEKREESRKRSVKKQDRSESLVRELEIAAPIEVVASQRSSSRLRFDFALPFRHLP